MVKLEGIDFVMFKLSIILAVFSLISFGILSSSTVSADDVVDNVSITVPSSCSITDTLSTAHTATINNGTYAEDIGTTDFTVFCNDNAGYSIYAVGYSGEEFGNTKMLATIGGVLTPSSDINTGLATSGNTSAWAMKIIPVTEQSSGTSQPYSPTIGSDTNGSYANYHVVPSTYTKVATFTSNTDVTIGSSLKTTYRVYIDPTKLAGNYNGKVRYTLVHPASSEAPLYPQTAQSGCINYFPNGSGVVGTMGCQPISASDTYKTLLASNYSREGYGFAGWNDKYDYSGNFYGPQEYITFAAGQYTGDNNGLALYAVWVPSAGSLQDSTKVSQLCGTGTGSLTQAPTDGTANLSSVSALTDQRDNETYAIAKLADGKCWMIENLRLESSNSDNSTGALAQGYGTSTTYGNFSGLADPESENFDFVTTANSLYYSGTQSGTATIDIGTTRYPNKRIPRYNDWNNQSSSIDRPQYPTNDEAKNNTTKAGLYSYGNYYNWSAAIADTSYNGTDNLSSNGTSLCPTGWHLPTGGAAYASGSSGGINVTGDPSTFREFYYLGYKIMDEVKTAYEDISGTNASYRIAVNDVGNTATKAFRTFPTNFLYSGWIEVSSTRYVGAKGGYWSSTASTGHNSYGFSIDDGDVYPGTSSDPKNVGMSIRCIFGS